MPCSMRSTIRSHVLVSSTTTYRFVVLHKLSLFMEGYVKPVFLQKDVVREETGTDPVVFGHYLVYDEAI